jgi:hypothetical protein
MSITTEQEKVNLARWCRLPAVFLETGKTWKRSPRESEGADREQRETRRESENEYMTVQRGSWVHRDGRWGEKDNERNAGETRGKSSTRSSAGAAGSAEGHTKTRHAMAVTDTRPATAAISMAGRRRLSGESGGAMLRRNSEIWHFTICFFFSTIFFLNSLIIWWTSTPRKVVKNR